MVIKNKLNVKEIGWLDRFRLNRARKRYYTGQLECETQYDGLLLAIESLESVIKILQKGEEHYSPFLYYHFHFKFICPFDKMKDQIDDLEHGTSAFKHHSSVAKALTPVNIKPREYRHGVEFLIYQERFNFSGDLVRIHSLFTTLRDTYNNRSTEGNSKVVEHEFTLMMNRVRSMMDTLRMYLFTLGVPHEVVQDGIRYAKVFEAQGGSYL